MDCYNNIRNLQQGKSHVSSKAPNSVCGNESDYGKILQQRQGASALYKNIKSDNCTQDDGDVIEYDDSLISTEENSMMTADKTFEKIKKKRNASSNIYNSTASMQIDKRNNDKPAEALHQNKQPPGTSSNENEPQVRAINPCKLKGSEFGYVLAQVIMKKFTFCSIAKQRQLFLYRESKGSYQDIDFISFCTLLHCEFETDSKIDVRLTPSTLKDIYNRILTAPGVQKEPDCFDRYESLLNVKNGVINLETKELLPHNDKYYFSTMIPIEYKSKAMNAPYFDYALQMAFKQEDNRSFFLEAFSYLLSNFTGKKIAFVFIGAGNTGKSMFLKLLVSLVGGNEFVSSIPLNQLSNRFSTAALYRKKINQAGELDVKKIAESATIKSVVGGDIIDAEFKGKDHFNFQCRTKCVFATNQLPVLDAKIREEAFFRRFQFIEFDTPVPKDRQIADFEKLLLQEEGEGILRKCVDTLHRMVRNNLQFTVSQQAKKLKGRFQNEKNPVELFLEERCVRDISCAATNQELFSEYVQYCRENCFDAQFSSYLFVKEIIRITGLSKKKLHRHRESSALWGIEGIALKLEHLEQ